MSLISKLFGGNTEKEVEESSMNWIPLTSFSQLKEIQEISKNETVLIFKHSIRCGISRMVIKQFEKQFDENMSNLKVYYLDLLSYREVSNEIGYMYQVLHQSPQLLVIQNGAAVAHDSHYGITSINLKSICNI